MTSRGLNQFSAVITDTSCFILLNKIAALGILHKLFDNVLTTPEVVSEYGEELPAWVQVISPNDKNQQEIFEKKVDRGEASAITLAIETPYALLVLDDLKGRKLAAKLNLLHTGTLGILVYAKKLGYIPLVKPYLDKIQSTNFRVAQAIIDIAISQAGE